MSELISFLTVIFSFPVGVYTCIALLLSLYWLALLLGIVKVEGINLSPDSVGISGTGFQAGRWGAGRGLASKGLMERLGFDNNIPNIVAFTFVILWGWLFSFAAYGYLVLLQGYEPSQITSGIKMLIAAAAFVAAIPPARVTVKPLIPLFSLNPAPSKQELVGSICQVVSDKVTSEHGRAVYSDCGLEVIVNVRCREGETLPKKTPILLLEYVEDKNFFWVIKAPDSSDLNQPDSDLESTRKDQKK